MIGRVVCLASSRPDPSQAAAWLYTRAVPQPFSPATPTQTVSLVQAIALGSCLSFVELMGGELDNLWLPVSLVLFVLPSYAMVALVLTGALVLSYVYYAFAATQEISAVAARLYKAYFWFTRPHTIVGTSLSIVTVSMVSAFNNTPALSSEQVCSIDRYL